MEGLIPSRGEGLQERKSAEQDLRKDLREFGEKENVADEPEKIRIQIHHFSSV